MELNQDMLTQKDTKDIKNIVQDIVIDASETILNGVQRMFDEHNAENKADFKKVNGRIDNLEKKANVLEEKVDYLKLEVRTIKDDVDSIKADISTVPTREEFERLKTKVNTAIAI